MAVVSTHIGRLTGASANNLLMQMQADISNAPVNRPMCVETTAMGAAYLAGLAVGYWASKEDVLQNWAIDRTFTPEITDEERNKKVRMWKKAVLIRSTGRRKTNTQFHI